MTTRVVLVTGAPADDESVQETVGRLDDERFEVSVVSVASGRAAPSHAGSRVLGAVRAVLTAGLAARTVPEDLDRLARSADVVVAMDRGCVPLVWRLRGRTRARLVNGAPAALHVLSGRPD